MMFMSLRNRFIVKVANIKHQPQWPVPKTSLLSSSCSSSSSCELVNPVQFDFPSAVYSISGHKHDSLLQNLRWLTLMRELKR